MTHSVITSPQANFACGFLSSTCGLPIPKQIFRHIYPGYHRHAKYSVTDRYVLNSIFPLALL